MLLQRPEQHRRSVSKSLGEKMSDANRHKGPGSPRVRAEPQRSLKMADREFRLPRPQPKPAAYHPAIRETRVERQGTVDQFHRGINVLAKISKRIGRVTEHIRIFGTRPKRSAGEIYALAAVRVGVIGPAGDMQILVTPCLKR